MIVRQHNASFLELTVDIPQCSICSNIYVKGLVKHEVETLKGLEHLRRERITS